MTSLVSVDRCPLCGGDTHEPALDGLLRRCVSCAMCWTDRAAGHDPTADHDPGPDGPIAGYSPGPDGPTTGHNRGPDDDGAAARQEELYDASYYETESYRGYFAAARQWRHEADRRLRWLLATARPASLVEAGPAGGFFVRAARTAGIDATGVEVSPVAARYARQTLGVPVRQGMFEAVALPAPVEAVCAFHVLEHVLDPRSFLGAARERLVPGGWLALEVPNIDSTAARLAGATWVDLAPRYHLWHFNPASLARLVTDCGFEIVRQDTIFATHYLRPARWPTRWGVTSVHHAVRAGSLRSVHPTRGNYLRLLARRTGR